MYFCALSGETPQEPVFSPSGFIYERRLILKYINENGTDPMSGEKLEESDLKALKASPKAAPPRPPTHVSVPALTHMLQNEWDATVLATYTMQQKYNAVRQELSHALYMQDAAQRVIARLIRERDEAREALANVHAGLGIAPSAAAADDVEMAENATPSEATLPAAVLDAISKTHQTLSAARRKRKPPAGYPSAEELKAYSSAKEITSLHSASSPGITSLAVSSTHPSQFLTGGNDKIVQLYDASTDKILASLKGHTKKVNQVAFREHADHNRLILSASADKVAKIWGHDEASGEFIPRTTIRTHKGEVTGLAVHPISTLVALSSADKTYSLHDLTTFEQLFRSSPSDEAFTSVNFHPDGTLIALGTPTSTIQIYDVRSGEVAASLTPADAAPFTVNTLSFSENGYHLLAPSSLSSVAIWDLRKTKIAHSIPLGDDFKVNKVVYDYSAQFLGVAGSKGGRVFAHKTWEELLKLDDGKDVTAFAFGGNGKSVWSAVDREVHIAGVLPA